MPAQGDVATAAFRGAAVATDVGSVSEGVDPHVPSADLSASGLILALQFLKLPVFSSPAVLHVLEMFVQHLQYYNCK
jgi:hypothetical protein